MPFSISDLPWELISQILDHLAPSTAGLYRLASVSRRWRNSICADQKLWRTIDFYNAQKEGGKVGLVNDKVLENLFGADRVAKKACRRLVLDCCSVTRRSLDFIVSQCASLVDVSCHGCPGISLSEGEIRLLFAERTFFGSEPHFTPTHYANEVRKDVDGPRLRQIGLIGVSVTSDAFEGPLSLSRLCGRILLLPTFFSNPFRTASLPDYIGFPMCECCEKDRRLVITFSPDQTVCAACGRYQHLCLSHVNKARCQACRRRLFCSWCKPDRSLWDRLGGTALRCSACIETVSRPSTLSSLLDGFETQLVGKGDETDAAG